MQKGLPVFDCFALTDDPNLLELQIMQQQTEPCSCMKSMTLTNFWFLHGRNQFQGCPASLAWRDTSFALCKTSAICQTQINVTIACQQLSFKKASTECDIPTNGWHARCMNAVHTFMCMNEKNGEEI